MWKRSKQVSHKNTKRVSFCPPEMRKNDENSIETALLVVRILLICIMSPDDDDTVANDDVSNFRNQRRHSQDIAIFRRRTTFAVVDSFLRPTTKM